ncbi:pre-mRNA splicing regulator USH1G-like [Paramacrobiotus metropolitanus]|uniref:pre-mRNA splicing regulator USH1G-like n=1 Tax=Paramacrobiotus metropolitanus TaxID=2943436 RepID=UPI00244643E0|nr:pre-mRNA splicing regulator USH1G-like [Paramacrobiotus metropolitanus]
MGSSAKWTDRFHHAAKDGNLDILQTANNKDLNQQDEDGMTPTNYAALYGNLAALRVITGRGGKPNKCDYLGNTPLHSAAARGHLDCVSFLINFGCNVFAMDNDRHTAMDVASLHGRLDIVRLLDDACARQLRSHPDTARKEQENAVLEADKRKKEFDKRQRLLQKKMEKQQTAEIPSAAPKNKGLYKTIKNLIPLSSSKENNRRVTTTDSGKKALVNDRQQTVYVERGDTVSVLTVGTEDSGFYGETDRPPATGQFPLNGFGGMNRAIFQKPRPINTESLYNLTSRVRRDTEAIQEDEEDGPRPGSVSVGSVGSAGSFAHRNKPQDSDGGMEFSGDEDDEEDSDEVNELQLFLAGNNLNNYYPLLQKEKVDSVANLEMVSESELEKIGFPLGPRKRLIQAILKRKLDLEAPPDITEARL